MMNDYEACVYKLLEFLDIEYEKAEHEAVFTVAQAKFIKTLINGNGCKNLFLKNSKGEFFLIILEDCKNADLKLIRKNIETSRLSFANGEELLRILNLTQGSVSPFGIINDKKNKVKIVIDKDLEGKRLLFHPNTNTSTVAVSFRDMIRFIEYEEHEYILTEVGNETEGMD